MKRRSANNFILKVNIALGKLFFIMDDKFYESIKNSIPIDPRALSEIRADLSVVIRKIANPKTKLTKEDIRFLYRKKQGDIENGPKKQVVAHP